jgi:SAM-dependent methyltransferase
MPGDHKWLQAIWPKVRSSLPEPPASVVEIGCGALGGFVPMLLKDGFEAVGVDPRAPEGPAYQQVEFERAELPAAADAVVACTSLHHVHDPATAGERIASLLRPGGSLVVIEWDWESLDEATARWAFDRLPEAGDHSWLHGHRDRWASSGESWDDCLRAWAADHGIHPIGALLTELDARFEPLARARGPYLFPALAHTTEADELAAISAGEIRAIRVDYTGRRA